MTLTSVFFTALKKVNSNEEVLAFDSVKDVDMEEEVIELFDKFVPLPPGVMNLDVKKGDGMCPYPRQMYAYLRSQEDNFLIVNNFLKGKEVEMRSLLVDWLTEVNIMVLGTCNCEQNGYR